MRILLLAQKTIYADIIIQKFCEIRDIQIVGLVYSTALFHGKTKIESLKMLIQKSGFGVFLGKALETAFSLPPQRNYSFPVLCSENINSAETVSKIRELKPDIIFSVYFNQLLKGDILTIPKYGAVNIHPSYLPQYRGVGPTFWVLANNEVETGVTYHFLTSHVDGGDIIERVKVPIAPSDSVHNLYRKCSKAAAEVLPKVIAMFLSGQVKKDRQAESDATYFGLPNREGYRKLKNNNRKFISIKDIAESFNSASRKNKE